MSITVNHEISGGAATTTTTTSDGGGGGGSSDRTAVTYEVDPVNGGYRVLTETVDGIPWTLSYDAQGRVIEREWADGGLLATINYDAQGFGYADSTTNIFVDGGAIKMFASEMATLKSALTTLGTAVSAKFYVADFDSNRGLLLEWNHVDGCFRGIGRTAFKAGQRFAYDSGDAPGTGELTAFTIVVPEWLRAAGAYHNLYFDGDFVSEADQKVGAIKANGTNLVTNTLSTITHNACEIRMAVQTPTLPDLRTVSTFTGYARGTSSAAHTTTTITAGTDITYTATMQHSTGGGAGTRSYGHTFYVEVHNP